MSTECSLLQVDERDSSPPTEVPESQIGASEDSYYEYEGGKIKVVNVTPTECSLLQVDERDSSPPTEVPESQICASEDSYYEYKGGKIKVVNVTPTECSLLQVDERDSSPPTEVPESQIGASEDSYYEYEGGKIKVVNVIIESWDRNETENSKSKKLFNDSLAADVTSMCEENKFIADRRKAFNLRSDSFVYSDANIRQKYAGDKPTRHDGSNKRKSVANKFSRKAGRTHSCPHCPSRFTIARNRNRHIKTAHEGVRYACLKCPSQFTNSVNLTRHIHLSHEKMQCLRCREIFRSKEARTAHNCEGSSRQTSITCNRCQRTFSCRSNLNKHVRVAHEGIVYACRVCDRSFRSRESVVEHTRTAHSLFLCTKCDKLSNTEAEFIEHVNLLHHTVIKPLSDQASYSADIQKSKFKTKRDVAQVNCEQCDKMFSSGSNLNKHIRAQHSREHWSCQHCSGSFSSNALLTRHVDSCHQDLFYSCPWCFLQFSLRKSLYRHMWTVHAEMLPAGLNENGNCRCEVCEKTFSCEANLKRHRQNKHEFIRHPCDMCTLSFRTKTLARDHRLVEHEGQLFVCADCPTFRVTFRTRIGLRNHTRSTHRKQPIYECSICAAGFQRRSQLTQHRRDFHEKRSNISESVFIVGIGDEEHRKQSEDLYNNSSDHQQGDLLAQAARSAGIDNESTELWSSC